MRNVCSVFSIYFVKVYQKVQFNVIVFLFHTKTICYIYGTSTVIYIQYNTLSSFSIISVYPKSKRRLSTRKELYYITIQIIEIEYLNQTNRYIIGHRTIQLKAARLQLSTSEYYRVVLNENIFLCSVVCEPKCLTNYNYKNLTMVNHLRRVRSRIQNLIKMTSVVSNITQ